jgi:hypothetical protein
MSVLKKDPNLTANSSSPWDSRARLGLVIFAVLYGLWMTFLTYLAITLSSK